MGAFEDRMKEVYDIENGLYLEASNNVKAIYAKALAETVDRLKDFFYKYADFGGAIPITPADKTQIHRLYGLMDELDSILERQYGLVTERIERLQDDMYEANYFRTRFAFENGVSGNLTWGKYSPEMAREAVSPITLGVNTSIAERIELERYKALIRQRQVIGQGLVEGKTYWEIVDDLTAQTLKDAGRIEATVQTESTRIANAARNDVFKRAAKDGIEGDKVWVSVKDGKTRDAHAVLNGKKADSKGFFHIGSDKAQYPAGFAQPKNSVRCRCHIKYVLGGMEGIDKGYSYDEWLEENGYEDPSLNPKTIAKQEAFERKLASLGKAS